MSTDTIHAAELGEPITTFVQHARRDFDKAARVLKETRSLSATNTFQAYVRVPGEALVVSLHAASPWADDQQVKPVVASFDGEVIYGDPTSGGHGKRYADVFRQQADVGVVIHVHGPYLGAWASAHRSLPIQYAPAQRYTRAREIPIYIDRRPGEPAFINEQINRDPNIPAILEANGGSTFWGKDILSVSKYILILEEGAYFQAVAETLGGSKEFGPGVLEQQWRMTGLAG
ncbi:class II aldolase/adducin family protein [Paraburkholderia lycopersici]|uniref:Class II Aldolase and Adducin N-terminal domain-containing protein n=1 Tax=Paraburkholderia lycopersici TaxID=416944 RepID=A0A1G6HAR6_9BURK|nr:class II aldolase/adducin family protein [Paraburkholderia lycopersici]SDB91243.1 Class II Aldolase and Adducin N-terminal domain-containing protein [Paraburkholderia lycopersici]